MDYSRLIDTLDSYILNQVSRASATVYELHDELDALLDFYSVSLFTLASRINKLQATGKIVCICEERDAYNSFFALGESFDLEEPLIDDTMLEEIVGDMSVLSDEGDVDSNVYLTQYDERIVIHCDEDNLVVLHSESEPMPSVSAPTTVQIDDQNDEEYDDGPIDTSPLFVDSREMPAIARSEDVSQSENVQAPTASTEVQTEEEAPTDANSIHSFSADGNGVSEMCAEPIFTPTFDECVHSSNDDAVNASACDPSAAVLADSPLSAEDMPAEVVCEVELNATSPQESDEAAPLNNAINSAEPMCSSAEKADDTANQNDDAAAVEQIDEGPAVSKETESTPISAYIKEDAIAPSISEIMPKSAKYRGRIMTGGATPRSIPVFECAPLPGDVPPPPDEEEEKRRAAALRLLGILPEETAPVSVSEAVSTTQEPEEPAAEPTIVKAKPGKRDKMTAKKDKSRKNRQPIIETEEATIDVEPSDDMLDHPLFADPQSAVSPITRIGAKLPEAVETVTPEADLEPVSDMIPMEETAKLDEASIEYSSTILPTNELERYIAEQAPIQGYDCDKILRSVFRDTPVTETESENVSVNLQTSFSELREDMRKRGYKLSQYVFQSTRQYYKQNYVCINKIRFATSLVVYLIALAMAAVGYFFAEPIVQCGPQLYIAYAVVMAVFPLYFGTRYVFYQDRHAPATFSMKLSMVVSLIMALLLLLVVLLFAFFSPYTGANISDLTTLVVPVLYPACVLLLLPMSVCVYAVLYKTKKFHM